MSKEYVGPSAFHLSPYHHRKNGIVWDLGILIDRTVTFKEHTAQTIRKSRRMLGFIIRNSVNFKNTRTLEVLYYSLVRSNLELGALVWNPSSAVTIRI